MASFDLELDGWAIAVAGKMGQQITVPNNAKTNTQIFRW